MANNIDNTVSLLLTVDDIIEVGLETIIKNLFNAYDQYDKLCLGSFPLTSRSFVHIELNNHLDDANLFVIKHHETNASKLEFIKLYQSYCQYLRGVDTIDVETIDDTIYKMLFVTGYVSINNHKLVQEVLSWLKTLENKQMM